MATSAHRRSHVPVPGPADELLLLALSRYFYLTVSQVTRLLYAPTSHTYAQARLKRLADGGCLQRHFLPRPTRTGSAPLVYSLARRGLNALREWGHHVERRHRPAEVRQLAYLHLAHTLALNDVLIALELLCRSTPDLLMAEVRHERDLKLEPVMVTLPDGTQRGVIPDGWVDLRIAGRYQECYAFELDRGTTAAKAWRRKVAALVAYADGPYQQAFGTRSLTVAVVATPGEGRSAQLRRWTEAELRSMGREDAAGLFRFCGASLAGRHPAQFFSSEAWQAPLSNHRELLINSSTISAGSSVPEFAENHDISDITETTDTSALSHSQGLEMSAG